MASQQASLKSSLLSSRQKEFLPPHRALPGAFSAFFHLDRDPPDGFRPRRPHVGPAPRLPGVDVRALIIVVVEDRRRPCIGAGHPGAARDGALQRRRRSVRRASFSAGRGGGHGICRRAPIRGVAQPERASGTFVKKLRGERILPSFVDVD